MFQYQSHCLNPQTVSFDAKQQIKDLKVRIALTRKVYNMGHRVNHGTGVKEREHSKGDCCSGDQ